MNEKCSFSHMYRLMSVLAYGLNAIDRFQFGGWDNEIYILEAESETVEAAEKSTASLTLPK